MDYAYNNTIRYRLHTSCITHITSFLNSRTCIVTRVYSLHPTRPRIGYPNLMYCWIWKKRRAHWNAIKINTELDICVISVKIGKLYSCGLEHHFLVFWSVYYNLFSCFGIFTVLSSFSGSFFKFSEKLLWSSTNDHFKAPSCSSKF